MTTQLAHMGISSSEAESCNVGFGMMSGGWWNFGAITILTIMVLAIGVILIIKLTSKANSLEKPIDILKKRYAKGEINKKEYEEMKNEL